jgi:ABC-type branched-subunit amino acid transport system ATPase component/MFS family permease
VVDAMIPNPIEGEAVRGRFSFRGFDGFPAFPAFVLFLIVVIDFMDQQAFNILLPNIRDAFHLSTAGILSIVAAVGPVVTISGLTVGYIADRYRRTPLASAGVALWGGSVLLTSMAPGITLLGVGRIGSGFGVLVNAPVHQALLADYYPPKVRPAVFGVYAGGQPMARFLGPLLAGLLAAEYGWRMPFRVLAVASIPVFVLTLFLHEPNRGEYDRRAAGANDDIAATEARPPSFGEAWRLLYTVASIRRIYFAFPLLVGSLQGFYSFMSLYLERVHGVDEASRGFIFAICEPFAVIGLLVFTPIIRRRMERDPSSGIALLRYISIAVAVSIAAIAVAPTLQLAIAANIVRSFFQFILTAALYSTMSLVMPPRARSLGYSVLALWALPAILALPILGGIADVFGFRIGLFLIAPMLILGGQLLASAGKTVNSDIENSKRYTLLESEAQAERIRFKHALETGEIKETDFNLLEARDIHVSYGQLKVLFGVDLKVKKGERVALLGTNGAGKSTLLKVVSGLLTPDVGTGGTLWYKNEDITFTTATERVKMGMVQIGGGRATFPTLTVEENLKMGAYPFLGDTDLVDARVEEVFQQFPVLRERRSQRAGTLSGGEQQMAALGRAVIAGPELLMIDELALGLAPVVMGEILAMVEAIVEAGTTLIVVEQSLNVALSITDHAYFMEKGEIRFSGRTQELLERDDIVRSVFFGATTGAEA